MNLQTGMHPKRRFIISVGVVLVMIAIIAVISVVGTLRTYDISQHFRECSETEGIREEIGQAISPELNESNDRAFKEHSNVTEYPIQYFEHAILEYHKEYRVDPNSKNPCHNVDFVHLGWVQYNRRYPNGLLIIGAKPNLAGQNFVVDAATKKHKSELPIPNLFWNYWNEHGKETLIGLPVTIAFQESPESNSNSPEYTTQYFEKAILRLRPGTSKVESLPLGKWRYLEKPQNWLAKVVDGFSEVLKRNITENIGSTVAKVGFPLMLTIVALFADSFLARERQARGIRSRPEWLWQLSLNLGIGGMAVDLAELLESNWTANRPGWILLVHIIVFLFMILCVWRSREAWSSAQNGVAPTNTWKLNATALALGIFTLVTSFFVF